MSDSTILNTITKNGVTNQSTATSKTTTKTNELGKDAFLQLMCKQMQYQDPLDPQDNSEYLSQLAQFSSLEQMTNVSTAMSNLATIVDNIDSSLLVGQLSGMIGKEVQWSSTATVTDASGNAIKDSSGNIQTVTTKHTGKVAGVSISDGSPSLIVTATEDGSTNTYKVAISDLTRVGSTEATT